MRKAIASTLIATLIAVAPGLSCYQALAGMNPRKLIPPSSAPIANIPPVDINLAIVPGLAPQAESPPEPKLDSAVEGPNGDAPAVMGGRGREVASASSARGRRELAHTLHNLSALGSADLNQDEFYDRASRRQFTMNGLMKAVFISALAVGGLRSCSLHRDWSEKAFAANRVNTDLHMMARSIEGSGRGYDPRMRDFQFFVLGMLNLHDAQSSGEARLDALNRVGDRNIEIMSDLLEKKERVLPPEELRPLYQEYLFMASLHGVNKIASFEDFQEMAGLYETFLAARRERAAGSFDTQRRADIEGLYQKHAGRAIEAQDAKLREAARKAGEDFCASVAVLAAASAAWLLRGLINRFILKPIRRIRF